MIEMHYNIGNAATTPGREEKEVASELRRPHMGFLYRVFSRLMPGRRRIKWGRFTETWLTPDILDQETVLDGQPLFRANRTQHSGKRRGGLCVYVNHAWCSKRLKWMERCSPDVEWCRPYYLPREFTSDFFKLLCTVHSTRCELQKCAAGIVWCHQQQHD